MHKVGFCKIQPTLFDGWLKEFSHSQAFVFFSTIDKMPIPSVRDQFKYQVPFRQPLYARKSFSYCLFSTVVPQQLWLCRCHTVWKFTKFFSYSNFMWNQLQQKLVEYRSRDLEIIVLTFLIHRTVCMYLSSS